MANIISSVGRIFNVANSKADQLTTLAKGVLCIPSMIAGLPDLGKSLIGNIAASASTILTSATSMISDLVVGAIGGAVSDITGSINSVINSVTGAIASIAGVIEQGKAFYKGLSDKVQDVKDFSESKENCNFAAATLLNCITSQALSNVSTKGAVDISKGLRSVSSFATEISDKIASPAGAINRTINKAAYEVGRAERMISKSNIF